MSAGSVAHVRSGTTGLGARLLAVLRAEGLLVLLVSLPVGLLAYRLADAITQDTWLSILGGREIVVHGLPRRDGLTTWTLGRSWVDQQWLAQLADYGLYRAGGMLALALVHVATVSGAAALAVVAGRRAGTSVRALGWLLALSLAPALFGVGNVRTQSFVYPLFVAVLLLLLRDLERPSASVFLTLPLLALWANLHGSAVLAAALVAVRGACDWRRPARAPLLVGGSAIALGATPWGASIIGYYRGILFDPALREFVTEWQAPTLELTTSPLFLLCGLTVALLARQLRHLHPFELLAPMLLLLLALSAVRNGTWLGLGALVLLRRPVARELASDHGTNDRLNALLGLLGLLVATTAVASAVAGGSAALERNYPAAAIPRIAAAATPPGRVYASERYADWLLVKMPTLRGRGATRAAQPGGRRQRARR